MSPPDRPLAPASWQLDVRGRLIATMALVASERGYCSTRVTDVLARARVSRRTYYVYFKNRDDCFFAAYEAIVAHLMHLIVPSPDRPEQPSLEQALEQVVGYFGNWPEHARVLMIEVLSAGPQGIACYERTMAELAERLARCPRWQPGDCGLLARAELAQAVLGAMQRMLQLGITDEGPVPSLVPALIALTTRVELAA